MTEDEKARACVEAFEPLRAIIGRARPRGIRCPCGGEVTPFNMCRVCGGDVTAENAVPRESRAEIVARLLGRARFNRDRGAIKDADIQEQASGEILRLGALIKRN